MTPPAQALDIASILAVIGLAASPIAELRGAIPLAITGLHIDWYWALPLAILGNLVPVPFILLFLDRGARLASRVSFLGRAINWVFERTRRRSKIVERYEYLGLVLLVAVPLPVTGAWTGSLAAVLFGLRLRHAFLAIAAGVIIAGGIVTAATLAGWAIFTAG